jgi:DNA modification methylase
MWVAHEKLSENSLFSNGKKKDRSTMMQLTDTILQGDALDTLCKLPDNLVDCIVTSPPYFGLRDYGVEGQLGLEVHPNEYIAKIVDVFREAYRVLKPTGTLFLNLGDTFFGGNLGVGQPEGWESLSTKNIDGYGHNSDNMKSFVEARNKLKSNWLRPKQKMLIPERVAIAMQDDGWLLRNSIIWYKLNHMPESVVDRLTRSYETVFFFTKSEKYYFNLDAIRKENTLSTLQRVQRAVNKNETYGLNTHAKYEQTGFSPQNLFARPGRKAIQQCLNPKGANPGDVWELTGEQNKIKVHFATFPTKLVKRCLSCGCPKNGVVLDPFAGSGTTLYVARKLAYHYLGIELNSEYIKVAQKRLAVIPERLDRFIVPQIMVCNSSDSQNINEVKA